MTAPTQPVTIDIADFGGPAVAGIVVTARLSDVDYTEDGTFVSTKPVTGTTNASGITVLQLFPNAVAPDGLGTRNTTVIVTAFPPASRPINVEAVIPDAPCNLADVLVNDTALDAVAYIPPTQLADFAALRAYAGHRTAVYVTGLSRHRRAFGHCWPVHPRRHRHHQRRQRRHAPRERHRQALEAGVQNADYAASVGVALDFNNNSGGVTVRGLEIDGNLANLVLGGPWGDTGIQLPACGIRAYGNASLDVSSVRTHHHGLDGLLIGYTGAVVGGPFTPVTLTNVRSEYNGRQGCSWVGGIGFTAISCKFSNNGRAVNTGTGAVFSSAPGAGFDIEAESSVCRQGMFVNCEFANNSGVAMTADSGDSADVSFHECKFFGTTNYSVWPAKPRFSFTRCTFSGMALANYAAANPEDGTMFSECYFSPDVTYSGNPVVFQTYTIDASGTNAKFLRCQFITRTAAVQLGSCISPTNRFVDCAFLQNGSVATANIRGTFAGTNVFTLTTGANDFSGYVNEGRIKFTGTTFSAGISTSLGELVSSASPAFTTLVGWGSDNITFRDARMEWGFQAPVAGTYTKGSIVWNLTAAAGGSSGWVCTVAGTPGTWQPFGYINSGSGVDVLSIEVADYTALRAYNGGAKNIRVTGYLGAAAPSGIAGAFVRDDADTTTADNGGTVIVTAGGKRYKRVFDGAVNVLWFGAKGDGVTDDTTAIQAAATAAAGKRLLFPSGTYKITAPVGLSSNTEVFLYAGAIVTTAVTNISLFTAVSKVNVRFTGTGKLSQTAAGASASVAGIFFQSCTDCVVDGRLEFAGFQWAGVYILNSSRCRVTGTYMHDWLGSVDNSAGVVVYQDSNDNVVEGNHFKATGWLGAYVQDPGGAGYVQPAAQQDPQQPHRGHDRLRCDAVHRPRRQLVQRDHRQHDHWRAGHRWPRPVRHGHLLRRLQRWADARSSATPSATAASARR
jgi:hypothetical protein